MYGEGHRCLFPYKKEKIMQKVKKTVNKKNYHMSQIIPSVVDPYGYETAEDQIDYDEYEYFGEEIEEDDRE